MSQIKALFGMHSLKVNFIVSSFSKYTISLHGPRFFIFNPRSTHNDAVRYAQAPSSVNSATITAPKIDFSDYKSAFEEKTTREILRSLFILQLCSYDFFVNNSLKVMMATKKLIGEKLFTRLMQPTFYEQFVAGDNEKDMTSVIRRLEKCHIRPMIACMMEDDAKSSIVE